MSDRCYPASAMLDRGPNWLLASHAFHVPRMPVLAPLPTARLSRELVCAGDHSGDWVRCEYVTKANYVQTAGCSRGKTVSTGISYTFGFSDGEISDAVGFNVSFSTTVTASNSVTIEPGGSGWFDVGFRYAEYKIGMEKRRCSPVNCLPWSKPKTVTVQKHLGDTFHYFGTGAEK